MRWSYDRLTGWMLNRVTYDRWNPAHPTKTSATAERRDTRGWLPQPPKGKRHTQRSVPVCCRPAAGRQHTYPPDLFRELSLHLGKPHTYSHKCIGIEKDCRGCGTPGVALFFTSPGQLFRPSLLHWLEALFTPSWVTHHIILPYKNK